LQGAGRRVSLLFTLSASDRLNGVFSYVKGYKCSVKLASCFVRPPNIPLFFQLFFQQNAASWLVVNYASLREYNFSQEKGVKLLPKKSYLSAANYKTEQHLLLLSVDKKPSFGVTI
jgi:hypothetical protein